MRGGLSLARGMRVGLFGGSFNPPHAGHLHVADTAMKRLGLHRVIWLVSPQNPLKSTGETARLAERLQAARRLARGPRMQASDIEARLRTRYSIDTVKALQRRWPAVRFVWIMGADNLPQLHRWRAWPELMRRIPIAVVARPGAGARARFAPAPTRFRHARRPSGAARGLPGAAAPAWADLRTPLHPASSTALRALAKPAARYDIR